MFLALQADIDMRKKLLTRLVFGAVLVVASCYRDALLVLPETDGGPAQPGSPGQPAGTGGSPGGFPGLGGLGGLGIQIPDGGLAALLGDGGLDQVICGPEVRLGAPCSSSLPGCALPSLGGVCVCVSGTYLCPASTAGPSRCPPGAATGTSCLSPLSTCLGGSVAGCICGLGTYMCF
ncbi:MAG TPA: hypothetical protein VJ801_09510 [Polyangia bacterium]|nr:hypothetical protein [Polyangia bacterium]